MTLGELITHITSGAKALFEWLGDFVGGFFEIFFSSDIVDGERCHYGGFGRLLLSISANSDWRLRVGEILDGLRIPSAQKRKAETMGNGRGQSADKVSRAGEAAKESGGKEPGGKRKIMVW